MNGFIKKLKKDKKLLLWMAGIVVATLLVPYITIPALLLWWFYKKSKFSKRFKTIVTSGVGGLIAILMTLSVIAYASDTEPHVAISQPANSTTLKSQQITIQGTYDPSDREVWVNGKKINASNGKFETVYQLQEGVNKIDVSAGNWKRTHAYLTVTRELTDAEKSARITPTSTPRPTKVITPTKTMVPTKAPTKAPAPTKSATSVQKFNIVVTSQIVKKVNGKYRYFFDIRNKDTKPFKGNVTIELHNTNQKSPLGEDTFDTTQALEPGLGGSQYIDVHTAPVSQEDDEFGVRTFTYTVTVNNVTVNSGNGQISDSFEDTGL